MDTYIIGLAMHRPQWRNRTKRLEELVFDVVRRALEDAGVQRQEIDSVTIAANDEIDGRSISSMLLAAPAGAYMKDENKVTDCGLYALLLGAMRIESGLHDLGLIASWSKSSIGPLEDIMRMRCDPFYVRPIGLNASISDGLFAQALCETTGLDEQAATDFVLDSYKNATRNERAIERSWPTHDDIAGSPYVAVPLREGHRAPITDGAVAMVIASEGWLRRHPSVEPLARVAGVGWATDGYSLGQARLAELNSFRQSTQKAIERAGLGSADEIDVFELECPTGYHGAAYERMLGIEDPSRRNRSGGSFAQNPYFCTGLVNAAEAVLQVADKAGAVQMAGARTALAHSCHGFSQQGNGAVVFEGVQ